MISLLLSVVFLKVKTFSHNFVHVLLFFYFKLYLNTYRKEIYSFICYYQKEKKFVQNILHSKYSVAFHKLLACQKNILKVQSCKLYIYE